MASEHLTTLGLDYHKEAQKAFGKALLFGMLVVFSHALTIKPSEFDVAGMKIVVDDVVVIHGSLALMFFYYSYGLITFSVEGSYFMQANYLNRMSRAFINNAKKRFKDDTLKRHRLRTTAEVKARARQKIALYQAFLAPFLLVMLTIIGGATILGAIDVFYFSDYLLNKGGVYKFVNDAFNELASAD